jgi:hypothetical protein
MLRIVGEYLLPLLLPTLIYVLWVAWRRRAGAAGRPGDVPEWAEGPWFWLILGGLGLSLAAFVITGLSWGHPTTERYHPAETINGRILPGHFGDKP